MIKNKANTTYPAIKTFSVGMNRRVNNLRCHDDDIIKVQYFSELLTSNFSMSEELAKAIGTVVVQALTENAKDESMSSGLGLDGDDDGTGAEDLDLGESDLPESSRDAGKVEEAEGPKAAPDLSKDFNELKSTVSNHSEMVINNEDYIGRYEKLQKEYFSEV